MKPFHYHEDPMYAAAAAVLTGQTVTEEAVQLEEGVEQIAAAVENLKKGDKTNFGVVTDIGSNSISFKAKDLPVTKIAFNQRKMGSKDFVLDKLVKLKEDVSLEEAMELDESIKTRIADLLLNLSGSDVSDTIKIAADEFKKNAVALTHSVAADKKDEYKKAIENMYAELLHSKTLTDFEKNGKKLAMQMKSFKEEVLPEDLEEGNGSYSMGTATITAPGNKLHGKQVSIFHKFDDGRLNVQYAKSDKKGDVLNLTLNKGQYKLDESVELEEAKSFGTTLNYTGSDRMMYKKSVVAFDNAIKVDAVSGIKYFFYDGYNPMVKLANGKYAELSKGELKELRVRFKEAGMKFPRPEQ